LTAAILGRSSVEKSLQPARQSDINLWPNVRLRPRIVDENMPELVTVGDVKVLPSMAC